MSALPQTMEVWVDGVRVEVEAGATVLEAAKAADTYVPTLCFDDRMHQFGACRVCMVAVEGVNDPVAACTTQCRDGMRVDTREDRARRVASNTVELVLSELPREPAEHTELAAVARHFELGEPRWRGKTHEPREPDRRHPYLVLQHELCISCGRCVRACDEVQGAFALTATGRGFESNITAGLDSGFERSSCVSCGACADTCPTDAITENLLLDLAAEPATTGGSAP